MLTGFGNLPSAIHLFSEDSEAGTNSKTSALDIILRSVGAFDFDMSTTNHGDSLALLIEDHPKEYVDHIPWFYKQRNDRLR
jgi:hypothetical protein